MVPMLIMLEAILAELALMAKRVEVRSIEPPDAAAAIAAEIVPMLIMLDEILDEFALIAI